MWKHLKNFPYILALDPSGSFYEGKGTTGWCLFDTTLMQPVTVGDIAAKDFTIMEEYWHAHIELIQHYATKGTVIVIEDYLLYANKAQEQTNSRMETPKLIGLLQYHCYHNELPYYMQTASEVKNRWNNDILVHKEYLTPYKGYNQSFTLSATPAVKISRHSIDAIRHATHYAHFKNNKELKR